MRAWIKKGFLKEVALDLGLDKLLEFKGMEFEELIIKKRVELKGHRACKERTKKLSLARIGG